MSVRKRTLQKKKNDNLWRLTGGFILASQSPQRRQLLEAAHLFPQAVISVDIDETPKKNEQPVHYVERVALEKAKAAAALYPDTCVLAADTIMAAGRRIIRKSQTPEEAREKLHLLSGRRHRVITGFCIIMPDGRMVSKAVQTSVLMKKLDEADIAAVLASEEWRDVAGYRIEGVMSTLVRGIIGSYPNIIGLPIFEVAQALRGLLQKK